MEAVVSPLPDDIEALKALLASATMRADEAEAKLANAHARESATEAVIAHLKLQIAKLKREQYGASAERTRRLLDQMELQLEELEADAAEDDLAAEVAAEKTATVPAFERKRPARKPFPEHLPRERVVVPAPCSCPACGGSRLSKLGEDVTETLEVIPRARKVVQTVREKFSCRDCETITHNRRRPSTSCRVAGLAPAFSPCCCSRSTASISPSTAKPSASPARACRSARRRSPTRSAPPPSR
jgi:hypothetical protein